MAAPTIAPAALVEELEAHVQASWKEALSHGTMEDSRALDPDAMFEDVFRELPPHLARQREQLHRLKGG